MAGGTTQPGQTVTSRVLSILAVFESSLAPRSLTDIAQETGLALSTTHRLVKELEEWDALQRDAQGRYQIGIRLWELGQHAGRQVRDIARPLLQDLFSLTQETVHIAIREQTDDGRHDDAWQRDRGDQQPGGGVGDPEVVEHVGDGGRDQAVAGHARDRFQKTGSSRGRKADVVEGLGFQKYRGSSCNDQTSDLNLLSSSDFRGVAAMWRD